MSDEQGEVDMSLSSTSGEGISLSSMHLDYCGLTYTSGATERGTIEPPESSQACSSKPMVVGEIIHSECVLTIAHHYGPSCHVVSHVQDEVLQAESLLAQVRSRSATGSSISTSAPELSGPLINTRDIMRVQEAAAAIQNAQEVLYRITGRRLEVTLPPPAANSQQGQAATAVTARAPLPPSPASAVAGPSTQQVGQAPAGGLGAVEDIGDRMLDLDLANRAPVRARRGAQ